MNLALFATVVTKVSVLYLMILVGYIAGKGLNINTVNFSSFVFYMLSPIVIFSGIIHMPITQGIAFLPILVLIISTVLCCIVYIFSYWIFQDYSRNILAYSSGSSSTGQFGLPVAILLFDIDTVGIYTVSFIGISIFENTVGFYIAAKGSFSSLECLRRLVRLPSIYAIILASTLQSFGIRGDLGSFEIFFDYIRNSYVVLGMVCIGLSLSHIKKFIIDWKFLSVSFVVKYVLWPLVMLAIVYIDEHITHFYPKNVHKALLVVSIVPLSSSVAMVASIFNYPTESFSVTVFINILLAIIYVPLMVVLLHLN